MWSRGFLLCQSGSQCNLFGYPERVVNRDAEVSCGALDHDMAEQQLNGDLRPEYWKEQYKRLPRRIDYGCPMDDVANTVSEIAIAETLDLAWVCHTKCAMGIKVKCDSCGALLDTKVESGAEARYIAKRAGWISEDGLTASDEGKDFCPNCTDTSSVEDKPKQ